MSGLTPKYGLHTWVESDPYLVQQFTENFEKIDSIMGDVQVIQDMSKWGLSTDPSVNNAPLINTKIAAIPNNVTTLIVCDQMYSVSQRIDVFNKRIIFVGKGGFMALPASTNTTLMFVSGCSDCIFQGITIDVNNVDAILYGMYIQNSPNALLRGVTVKNVTGTTAKAWRVGIAILDSSNNVRIDSCLITNIAGLLTSGTPNYILIATTVPANMPRDITVVNTVIDAPSLTVNTTGIRQHGGVGMTANLNVVGCKFTNTRTAIATAGNNIFSRDNIFTNVTHAAYCAGVNFTSVNDTHTYVTGVLETDIKAVFNVRYGSVLITGGNFSDTTTSMSSPYTLVVMDQIDTNPSNLPPTITVRDCILTGFSIIAQRGDFGAAKPVILQITNCKMINYKGESAFTWLSSAGVAAVKQLVFKDCIFLDPTNSSIRLFTNGTYVYVADVDNIAILPNGSFTPFAVNYPLYTSNVGQARTHGIIRSEGGAPNYELKDSTMYARISTTLAVELASTMYLHSRIGDIIYTHNPTVEGTNLMIGWICTVAGNGTTTNGTFRKLLVPTGNL